MKSADGWSFLAAAGDFYNDGRQELAVLNPDPIPPHGDYDQLLPYLFGLDANGALQLTTYAQTAWTFAFGADRTLGGLLAGDFNGDGRADLAVLVQDPDNSMRFCADNDATAEGSLSGYCVPLPFTYPVNSTLTATVGQTSYNGRSNLIMASAGPQLPGNPYTAVSLSVARPDTGGIFNADQINTAYDNPVYQVPYSYTTGNSLLGNLETNYYSGASPDTSGSGLADFLVVLTTPVSTGTQYFVEDVPQIDQTGQTSLPDIAGQAGFTLGYAGPDRHLSEIYVNGGAPLDSARGHDTGGYQNTVIDSYNLSTGTRDEQWFGGLALPIRAGWRFFDANGDGRTDLVYLSRVGTQLTIDAFMSGTSPGWTHEPPQTITLPAAVPISQWQTVQLGAPPDAQYPQGYVSGLVAANSDSAGNTSIDTLSYTANGWTLATTPPLPTGNAPTHWMVADVNGDGRSDLVGITTATTVPPITDSVTITTIRSDGFAHWSSQPDVEPVTLPVGSSQQATDLAAWRVADLNGDGRSDLVFLDADAANPDPNSAFAAAAILSNGDGTWTIPNPAPAIPASDHPQSWWADQTWQPANSVQPDVTSLVHVAPSGPGLTVDDLSLSPDWTSWRIGSIKDVQLPQDVGVNPWQWGTIDFDETGLASFTELYISEDGHLHDMVVAPNISPDLISTVTSPDGETATMSFSPSRASSDADAGPVKPPNSPVGLGDLRAVARPGSDAPGPNGLSDSCYLPEGAGEPVLTAESLAVPPAPGDQFNLYSPGGASTTVAHFAYSCPQYSTLAPGLLGFAYVGEDSAPTSAVPGIAERSTIDQYEVGPNADRRLLTHLVQQGNAIVPPSGMANVIAQVTGGTPTPTQPPFQVDSITYSDRAGPAGTISDVAQTMSRSCDNATGVCPTRSTTYDYDDFGNIRTVASSLATDGATPAQVVTSVLDYVPPNQDNYLVDLVAATKVTDSSGDATPEQTRFCYDNAANCDAATNGLLTTASRWDNTHQRWVNQTYAYTDAGALQSITDPNGHTQTYQYADSSDPQLPTAVCSADLPSECVHTTWDDVLELPVTTTDSNLQTTTRYYDPFGRVCEIDLPNGGSTVYAYHLLAAGVQVESASATQGEPGNTQARRRSPNLAGTLSPGCGSTVSDVQDHSTATYDAAGRLTVLQQQMPGGISSQYFGYFDATSDTPGATTEPAFPNDCPRPDNCGEYSAVTYDYLGLPVNETEQSGNQATWSYSDGDVQHIPVSISTAADGSFRDASAVDGWGQLLQESTTGGQSSGVSTTTYTYDGLSRLTTSTDQIGVAQTYSYDSLDRLTAESDPDRGRTAFGYDAAGNLISQTTADGIKTDYTYDALNRLTSSSHPGGNPVTFTYGETPSAANNVGRLATIQDPDNSAANCPDGASDTYAYDSVPKPHAMDQMHSRSNPDVHHRLQPRGIRETRSHRLPRRSPPAVQLHLRRHPDRTHRHRRRGVLPAGRLGRVLQPARRPHPRAARRPTERPRPHRRLQRVGRLDTPHDYGRQLNRQCFMLPGGSQPGSS